MSDDNRLLAAALRSSFTSFALRAFRELNPSITLDWNWHLYAIIHFLEQIWTGAIKRGIINMPPRSLKSELCSIIYPAFVLGHDPSQRIISITYAQTLSSSMSNKFRRLVSAQWYRELFPRFVLEKDTEESVVTTQGGMRFATSVGGALTGIGGSLIILDDPLNPHDAPSASERAKVIRFFNETVFSRLDNRATGAILLVMQRLHDDDLAGHLLADGTWAHLNLPVTATQAEDIPVGEGKVHHRQPGDLLHPERFPQSVIEESRRRMGSAAYEAQFQQSPVPDGGNIIKRDWLGWYASPPPIDECRIIQSWDTAYKGDVRNDYSVCTTWAERHGCHYLVDVFRKKMEFPELLSTAASLYGSYKPSAVLIEDQGSGQSLIQQLKQDGVPAIGCPVNRDKVSRLTTVSPMFEAGTISLPEEAPWLADLLRELLGFPATKYDDQVDSISQYLGWARERSGASRFDYDMMWDDSQPTVGSVADMIVVRNQLFGGGDKLSAP